MAERINQDIDNNNQNTSNDPNVLNINSNYSESRVGSRQNQFRENSQMNYQANLPQDKQQDGTILGLNHYSNLEFGNSIFKNRPFSSENKYGHIKQR